MPVDMKMPILIVDDYKTMLRIVRNILKHVGFENVDEAADGGEAFNKMKEKQYGLVISDWNMEPVTGLDLLKQLRADGNMKSTPFIMITAESKTENVIAAKEGGRAKPAWTGFGRRCNVAGRYRQASRKF
jgi:two-component system chemotaxis response regulator CheY